MMDTATEKAASTRHHENASDSPGPRLQVEGSQPQPGRRDGEQIAGNLTSATGNPHEELQGNPDTYLGLPKTSSLPQKKASPLDAPPQGTTATSARKETHGSSSTLRGVLWRGLAAATARHGQISQRAPKGSRSIAGTGLTESCIEPVRADEGENVFQSGEDPSAY